MDIVLEDLNDAGKRLVLPVNPEEITVRREKQLETITIHSLGEVDFGIGERVKEIGFSSFFPYRYDSRYCRYEPLPKPQVAMDMLNDWKASRQPVRLMITGQRSDLSGIPADDELYIDINVLILLTVHNSTIRGGEPGDLYYELTCRTWREIGVRTTADADDGAAVDSPSALRPRTDTNPVPRLYVVKPGDTLWQIAKKELGDGARYRELYEWNRAVIGADPDIILPGQELVMPV